jgi:succinoglycan biosynthesis transport protein ExoP
VQDQSFPISEARVVASANPPLMKSWPKTSIVLIVALAFGVCAGIAFAFLKETILRTVRTPREVEQVTGLPCIASLPRIQSYAKRNGPIAWLRGFLLGSDEEGDARALMLNAITNPLSPASKCLREIKFVTERHQADENICKVIGIVSAISGEGKSTVASNLAFQFAQSRKRALLLDWDINHPFLSQTLLPNAKEGLLEAINARQPVGLLSLRTRGLPLYILPTIVEDQIEHTAELLCSSPNIELLDNLKTQYDVIIIDFPPMADSIDVRATSDMVDAYIMIVGYDKVQKNLLSECVSQGKVDISRVIGAVLNGIDLRQHVSEQSRLDRYMPWIARRPKRCDPPPQKAA